MNINIGGTKGWSKVDAAVRAKWKIMDVAGSPDFMHDLNSGQPFALANGSVDNYYTSETLEHVRPDQTGFVFREMYRTLTPGGLVRIVVPDITKWIRAYVNGDKAWLAKHNTARPTTGHLPPTLLGDLMQCWYSWVKNQEQTARSGHNAAFDPETLQWYLSSTGFKNIKRLSCDDCSPVFRGLDFPRYRETGLYMEAQK